MDPHKHSDARSSAYTVGCSLPPSLHTSVITYNPQRRRTEVSEEIDKNAPFFYSPSLLLATQTSTKHLLFPITKHLSPTLSEEWTACRRKGPTCTRPKAACCETIVKRRMQARNCGGRTRKRGATPTKGRSIPFPVPRRRLDGRHGSGTCRTLSSPVPPRRGSVQKQRWPKSTGVVSGPLGICFHSQRSLRCTLQRCSLQLCRTPQVQSMQRYSGYMKAGRMQGVRGYSSGCRMQSFGLEGGVDLADTTLGLAL